MRIAIAAMLLRATGAQVTFEVKRKTMDRSGKGTTIAKYASFKQARKRMSEVRCGDNQQVTVTMYAVCASKHGTVQANTTDKNETE